ncbi:TPA: hypothetical protein DIC20_02480 [Candidatus Dependentiae bacterium]|nr:MAG: hypothetical protein US03_C0003G0053 [candidate division TM6 bacterium GW2011_GWF2_36_131]KKQ03372.1 MAG: hypothetical protein US13_C0003G0053 [candidate division TM6 bacterium GW2011_GWE2_36_25]KKQ18618.1 MAG: hypothetical protein US32_C0024G0002 [candidate division TM6 bacterium GW2011_GWA2_36_9]HBR70850.1 hypothetical protein [Candidatus Dependentiae bacterium]HCU00547.1 hypothetical protein [Candidatus Dependentiae bacterium]
MKKIFFAIFLIIHQHIFAQLQFCPGIPITCQFRMNQWAEYDLLPQLRAFNLMINEKLSKLPNLKKRMSDVKFSQEIHLNAERIITELTHPIDPKFLKAFERIQNDPERNFKVKEVLKQIQGIINAYDQIGQEGIDIQNLEPLNNAIAKNGPLLKKTEEELAKSQKANFDILAPTNPTNCKDFLVSPEILCAGIAASMPNTIWFDLTTAQHIIHTSKGQSQQEEAINLEEKVIQPTEKAWQEAIQAPQTSYEAATEIS